MRPYYQKDGITLYCGDCLDILPHLKADVVVTDPPYNARKNYGKKTDERQGWAEWCEWFDIRLEACLVSAPDVLCFMSQTAWKNYARFGKHVILWTMVWHKPLALSVCAYPFLPHWEPIVFWGKSRKRHGAYWGGDVVSINVTKNRDHPTEKPLALMHNLVSRFQGVVLDPFAGSGTTLEAARSLRREAIGIEIEEKWCELIVSRLEMRQPQWLIDA